MSRIILYKAIISFDLAWYMSCVKPGSPFDTRSMLPWILNNSVSNARKKIYKKL